MSLYWSHRVQSLQWLGTILSVESVQEDGDIGYTYAFLTLDINFSRNWLAETIILVEWLDVIMRVSPHLRIGVFASTIASRPIHLICHLRTTTINTFRQRAMICWMQMSCYTQSMPHTDHHPIMALKRQEVRAARAGKNIGWKVFIANRVLSANRACWLVTTSNIDNNEVTTVRQAFAYCVCSRWSRYLHCSHLTYVHMNTYE